MPIHHLRRLTGNERSSAANRELALLLAVVAGGINAGGYLALRQFTSHMSGTISTAANSLVEGNGRLLVAGAEAVLSFIAGAALTGILVNWARRRLLKGTFAIPLMFEATALAAFAATSHIWNPQIVRLTLLCFAMGLQNAMITKLSNAEIRTTHVTGMITDIGIEVGKMLYINGSIQDNRVVTNWAKIRLLAALVGAFFLGGVGGAFGFKHIGFFFTLPSAVGLVLIAAVPMIDDIRTWVTAGNSSNRIQNRPM